VEVHQHLAQVAHVELLTEIEDRRASGAANAVPELTRSADIKLNARVLLRRLRIALSSAGRAEQAKTAH